MTIAPNPGDVWVTPHGVKMRMPKTTGPKNYIRATYYHLGERKHRSLGKDWKEAWAEAHRIDTILATEQGDTAGITVATLGRSWITASKQYWGQRYLDQNEDVLAKSVLPIIGAVQIGELNRNHIRQCLDQQTVISGLKRVRTLISVMLNWAEDEQLIDNATALLPPKTREMNGNKLKFKTRESAPATEDVLALARAALQPRVYDSPHASKKFALPAYWSLMFLTAGFCGLRTGELWALTGKDIDDAVLHVRKQVQYLKGGVLQVTAPKNGSVRDVYIQEKAGEFPLRELLAQRAEEVGPDGLLFPSKSGTYVRRTNFVRDVMNPVRDIAWSHRKWVMHDLRHHFCRSSIDNGVSIADVAIMAGHQNVSVTMTLYISPNDGVMERIAGVYGE